MWLLVGGRGEKIDISVLAEKFRLVPQETGAQVWFTRGRWTVDDKASCVSHTRRWANIFYITSVGFYGRVCRLQIKIFLCAEQPRTCYGRWITVRYH